MACLKLLGSGELDHKVPTIRVRGEGSIELEQRVKLTPHAPPDH